jgi:hypothetical protein
MAAPVARQAGVASLVTAYDHMIHPLAMTGQTANNLLLNSVHHGSMDTEG